jgi:hypothetical protein
MPTLESMRNQRYFSGVAVRITPKLLWISWRL